MALTPGIRLGPYEVTALIGEGGMGQVYRATDTTLGREVAIKILPDAFAADPDRLARFEREAKTLASLNHPHIAAIYAVEQSAGMHALVMELVEGDDLSQRIARGAIPIDEALPFAKQIAEALEVAHEQGIIHRDLKPANIKLRPDGTVKVLDFGLAKAMESTGAASPNVSQSPTITTPAMTQAGMILGTAAYMSPEQARGKAVDKRADIWAFGAVLFEMLTGQRVFAGEDVSDTLANVLKTEPDWNRLPAGVSSRVRLALRACLQKDPKQRIGDVQSMRLALEGAFETTAPQTTATSSAKGGRLVWAALATAAAVIIALAVPTVRHLRETPPQSPPETRVDIVTPATDQPASFALSPDGRQIVFVASGDGASRLWLRPLATTTAQPLAATDGATSPFWSPDSRSVAFFADGMLKRLDLGGDQPQTLAEAPGGSSWGGTWNADGVILFTPTSSSPLSRVSAAGGNTVQVTTLDRQLSHRFSSFLPDGRQFLFYAQGAPTPETAGIYLGSLETGGTTRLTGAASGGVYLASGYLLWVRDGTLVAQRLDLARRELVGEPVTVGQADAFSVSQTGMVAYRSGAAFRRQLTWFDRSGKALGTLGEPDDNAPASPRLSPDGRRVAAGRTVQGNADIWLLDGARTSRFTFDAALDRFPLWSPDGSRIVFESNRQGRRNLYLKLSSSAGAEELLLETQEDKNATDWSADGRFLLFYSNGPKTDWDLWILPLEGDRKPWVFLNTPFAERWGQFSPDGRWVAYISYESGRFEVYIRPFVEPGSQTPRSGVNAGGQWQVSTAGGVAPRWRSDGKELYYIDPDGQMMAVPIAGMGATLEPGTPVALFHTRVFGGGTDTGPGPQYDVAPDGRFLINTMLDEASAPITLLQNWNPETRK